MEREISMILRRIVGVSGFLIFAGTLLIALPGCGGSQEVGPDGAVKAVPVTNPAPGAAEPEKPGSPK